MLESTFEDFLNQHVRNFGRSLIGFEPVLRRLSLGETIDNNISYPPYNLVHLSDNRYRIVLAVAGFAVDQLDITLADNKLIIMGNISKENTSDSEENDVKYLYKGIAERNFTRSFVLADHVIVADAKIENGLLTIELQQEIPEALKPRKISIHNMDTIEVKPKKTQAKIAASA